jgi:uncharacterized protein YbaP (TraB family)
MIRILTLCLLLFAMPMTGRAAAETCGGSNILTGLRATDPQTYAEIEKEAAAIKNGEAMLWKIEKNGEPPSYLLGTAHVTEPRVTTLSREARDALMNTKTVALELAEVADRNLLARSIMRNAKLLAMPDAGSVWDVIPDEDEKWIKESQHLPRGAAATLSAYQPWVIATMLSIPLCEQERKAGGALTLDEIVAQTAERQGAKVMGLETIEDQLGVFAGLSMDDQVAYLVATAKLGPQIADYYQTMIDLYLERRMNMLMPMAKRMDKSMGAANMMQLVEKELIEKRNRNMLRSALGLLPEGNVFVAVGALHLPGDKGLVELLRNSGYVVTPIN